MSSPTLATQTEPLAVCLQRIAALCTAAVPAGVPVILGKDEKELLSVIEAAVAGVEPGIFVTVSASRGENAEVKAKSQLVLHNDYEATISSNPLLQDATKPGAFDLMQTLMEALHGQPLEAGTTGAGFRWFAVTGWEDATTENSPLVTYQIRIKVHS